MAHFTPEERPLIIGQKVKTVSIEYDCHDFNCYPYTLDEDKEEFKLAIDSFTDKYPDIRLVPYESRTEWSKGTYKTFNWGMAGLFCDIEFPYDYPDNKVEEICKELIKTMSKSKYLYE